jgi:Raf kinase inhibitor-like YbhB/YbcL family protein
MLEKLPDQLGHLLQGQRAGLENIALNRLLTRRRLQRLSVHSSAFEHFKSIPSAYTADGAGLSPPLDWRGVPSGAGSVVLIVEDADSPTPNPLVHAIAVNLAAADDFLPVGALTQAHGATGAIPQVPTGLNSFLMHGWLPPDPPPGHGQHRYAFQVFALAHGPDFSASPGRQELFDAISTRAVAAGCLIGTYERAQTVSTKAIEPERALDDADIASATA